MNLTKIDVAAAHIDTAVRLFFHGAHPASTYLLAATAREILTTIGDKMRVETVLHDLAADKGISLKEAAKKASDYVGFLKHADKDPEAILAGFQETDVMPILFIACHDFGRVTKGMPISAQVYEAWWFASNPRPLRGIPTKRRELILSCIRCFPYGFRTADLASQRQMGLDALSKHERDPRLTMTFNNVVDLAEAAAQ